MLTLKPIASCPVYTGEHSLFTTERKPPPKLSSPLQEFFINFKFSFNLLNHKQMWVCKYSLPTPAPVFSAPLHTLQVPDTSAKRRCMNCTQQNRRVTVVTMQSLQIFLLIILCQHLCYNRSMLAYIHFWFMITSFFNITKLIAHFLLPFFFFFSEVTSFSVQNCVLAN